MKNKAVTYFLIVAVAALWGTIIFKVIAAATNNDDDAIAVPVTVSKNYHEDYSEKPDTTRLLLNYPDPFTGTRRPLKDTTATPAHQNNIIAISNTPRALANSNAINWNFIKYAGFIKNAGSKKLIAILVINGKNVSLQEGETADNVRLLKNLRDSVKISYSGHSQFITIDHSVQ